MSEIIAILILFGVIVLGTITISYRYIRAKARAIEKKIERPDYIKLEVYK